MKKKRYNIGLDKGIAIAAKKRAAELEMPFNRYVEELIKQDLYRSFTRIPEKKEVTVNGNS